MTTIDSPYSPPKHHTLAAPTVPRPLPRLWPALALVTAYWLAWAIMTVFFPATFSQFLVLFWSPFVLSAGILVWWLFFSRQPLPDRLWGIGCLIVVGIAVKYLVHSSMGMGLIMYATPVAITAVILTLAFMRVAVGREANHGRWARWLALAAASVLAWGYFTLIRVDGVTGNLQAERSWRWSPTAEDKFLAERRSQAGTKSSDETDQSAAPASVELVATAADSPEFRGANRDGHLRNVDLNADWTAQPPTELWRKRVGPGWSSFAVVGHHVYTQEQRGEAEAVICLHLATGEEIWSHEDKRRFYEVVAGAGPRATPTFHQGKVYSLGGGGVLNCLDAATGKVVWTRDIAADAGTKPPQWGFSSSPLVAHGIVTVFAGSNPDTTAKTDTDVFAALRTDTSDKKEEATNDGKKPKKKIGLLAYDALSGEPRWAAGRGAHSYSSPQILKVAGQEQLLMVSDYGLEAFDPASGRLIWDHEWNLKEMFRVCQPHVVGDSQVLIGTPMTEGTRLLTVAKEGDAWSVKEEWTSKDLKPYFNDFVRLGNYLYGLDGDILVCIDLATGKKKWKKGRYGHGQVLLIGNQGRMLVISDKGEAILTEVSPEGLVERGKFQAINGKTWNHPVIAVGKLLVRNGEQMACFDLLPSTSLTRLTSDLRPPTSDL
jgi:outer membrane protein assembly factor BamB